MMSSGISSQASGGVYPRRANRRDQPGGSRAHHSFRMALGCFVLLGVIVGNLGAANDRVPDPSEPPVRLKKKMKPQPQTPTGQPAEPARQKAPPKRTAPPPKAGESKEDPGSPVDDVEEKIREITNRIAKNMNQVEQRLQKHDPGAATQQTQGDILRDLDELIEQTRRQQQQVLAERTAPTNQNNRMQRNQASSKPTPSAQDAQARKQGGNSARGSKIGPEGGMSKIADLYKDVWGHLPETLRQEMDQYSREQFMAKYGDLLKQYYATIAEKGRRKGEP